jgi:hypothetical protein
MVTAEAYRRYLERKDKSTEEGEEKKEQDIHLMLDEIAKMRGYKEKLVGKRKIRPIIQYVDYILDKNYGFKPVKRGEKYYDRKSKEFKVADKNISPIEQYIALLGEQKMKVYESEGEYSRWVAEKEGFKSLREKEESKAAELGLSSIGEYNEYIARERGFDSYEQYKQYINGIYAIRGTYTNLIPQEDFDAVFKLIEERWEKGHEKFITFCDELWKDTLRPHFDKSGKTDAVTFVSDVKVELEKFHQGRPGSMNIYGIDDIAIGLSYCLKGKGVNAILSKDSKTITFRKIQI